MKTHAWHFGACTIHLRPGATPKVGSVAEVADDAIKIADGRVYVYAEVVLVFVAQPTGAEKSFFLSKSDVYRLTTCDGRGIWPNQLRFLF